MTESFQEPRRLSRQELEERLAAANLSPEARDFFNTRVRFSRLVRIFPMFDDQEFRDKLDLIVELRRAELIRAEVQICYNPYETGVLKGHCQDHPKEPHSEDSVKLRHLFRCLAYIGRRIVRRILGRCFSILKR